MKAKRFFKIALGLLLLLLLSGGAYIGHSYYTARSIARRIEEQKRKRMVERKEAMLSRTQTEAPGSRPAAPDAKDDTGAALASKTSVAPPTLGPSACTSVYEKHVAGKPFTEALEALFLEMKELAENGQVEKDPCVMEVADRLDLDHMQELFTTCNVKLLETDESKKACITMLVLGWGGLVETQFDKVTDLSEVPDEALHTRIIYRLIDRDRFKKNAGPKESAQLFAMLDEMHKRRPAIDYGTTRDEIIADLYNHDPRRWKDDFQRVLQEAEDSEIPRAASMYYVANGGKLDQAFLSFAGDLVERHPQSAWAHFYHGCALTGVADWDGASRAEDEAERLTPGFKKKFGPELRKSISEKSKYFYEISSVSLTINMPRENQG